MLPFRCQICIPMTISLFLQFGGKDKGMEYDSSKRLLIDGENLNCDSIVTPKAAIDVN